MLRFETFKLKEDVTPTTRPLAVDFKLKVS